MAGSTGIAEGAVATGGGAMHVEGAGWLWAIPGGAIVAVLAGSPGFRTRRAEASPFEPGRGMMPVVMDEALGRCRGVTVVPPSTVMIAAAAAAACCC